MAIAELFWLGPLGQLAPLAVPEGSVNREFPRTSTSSTTLNGRQNINEQGYRHTWEFDQAYCEPDDASMLEAMYSGIVPGPLRIIDPMYTNRFRPSVAAPRITTIYNGSSDCWAPTPDSGAVSELAGAGYPAIAYTDPHDGRSVTYSPGKGVQWQPGAGSARVMYPNGPLLDSGKARPSRVDPVLPGETVTASFLVKLVGVGTAAFALDTVAADGTVTPGSLSAITGTTWATVSSTVTAGAGVVGVMPRFTASAATVLLFIGPGQLQHGSAVTTWRTGYGCPEVNITSAPGVSDQFPLSTVSLSIQEL